MKASKKIISLILAVVMIFSAVSVSAFAGIVPSTASNSVETLIKNANLATLVENLLRDLNGAKTNLTGTVLKLVFTFMDDDSLNEAIANVAGDTAVVDLSDAKLATILLDWLDANLPEWTKDLDLTDYKSIAKLVGVSNLDLTSVDNIIGVVYDACTTVSGVAGLAFGDVHDLKGGALKGVKRSGGDLNVIYALFQWISDNRGLIGKFVKGGLGSNGLSTGSLLDGILGDNLADINNMVKNIPDFAKSYIYLTIDGKAAAGDIKKDAKGDWGKSAYASYTADEMLAAAVIRLIEEKEPSDVIAKADCDAALSLTFYQLLAKYGKELYARFAVEPLNTSLKELLGKLKDFDDTKDIFNYDYNFTSTTFDAAFADIDSKGVIAQLNNILCTIMKTIMNADVYKSIGFVTGDNSKLNDNFAKACRYILPILANHSDDLGFDFTSFTASAVKDMTTPEMAVAVLKIFFPGWFKDNYDAALVNKAKTVAQLGVLAVYFTATNDNWITLDNGFSVTEYAGDITTAKIDTLTDDQCVDIMVSMGAKMGAYALDAAKDKTYFNLDKTANTWQAYINNIVDWAIKFAKGIPAVMVNAGVYNSTEDAFYKINVALNEVINFNFLSDVGDQSFALDTETLIFDSILKNLFNFDLNAVFGVFAKNTNSGNILNEGTVISSIIGVVDRLLTSVFSHTCGTTKTFTEEVSCTEERTVSYCSKNGHYVGTPTSKTINNHDYKLTKTVAATCAKAGSKTYTCTKCGATKTDAIAKSTTHKWTTDTSKTTTLSCTNAGMLYEICSVCKKTQSQMSAKLGHNYNSKGICTRCKVDKNHTHTYKTKVITAATTTADGKKQQVCSICGLEKTATTIKKASSVTLSTSTYSYDGTAKKPTVTVKDSAGNKLVKDTDYTVSYTKNTAIGKGTAKVTFKGNYSGTKSLTFTIKPAKVTGVKVSSQTATGAKLSWTAVKGVTNYNVYKIDGTKATKVNKSVIKGTTYSITGLSASKSYKYAVEAVKTVDSVTYKSSDKTSVTFSTAPAQVKGLKVSSQTTTSIKLVWTKVTGAKYYKVEKSVDGKKWTVVSSATTATSYTASKLTAGKSYQFRVTALDSTKKIAGKASASLKASTLTNAPSVTLKSAKSKTVTVTWKSVTGASKYYVYKSTDGKKWSKVSSSGTTKTTYDITKLTGGKKIYVQVTAVNANGKESAKSAQKYITVKK